MANSHACSPERAAQGACLALALLVASAAVAARVPPPESIYLGTRTLSCDRGLRVYGKKTVFYPAGKAEWLSIAVPSDLIVYECGYRRARVICAIHTTEIKVRRSSSRGTFEVKCYGPPRRTRGTGGAEAPGTVEPGTAEQ